MSFLGNNTEIAAGALLVRINNGGAFYGITGAIDAATTVLDVVIAAGAWALLVNGQFFDTNNGLVATSFAGNTVNGSYHLYLDAVFSPSLAALVPVFSTGTAAPSATALKIADFTVASNVISAVTGVTQGFSQSRFGL